MTCLARHTRTQSAQGLRSRSRAFLKCEAFLQVTSVRSQTILDIFTDLKNGQIKLRQTKHFSHKDRLRLVSYLYFNFQFDVIPTSVWNITLKSLERRSLVGPLTLCNKQEICREQRIGTGEALTNNITGKANNTTQKS